MTARTSELLAKELDALHLDDLAKFARDDHFHDFLSQLAMPTMELVTLLHSAAQACPDGRRTGLIMQLRQRVINGDFDADHKESEEWAGSPSGQDAIGKLVRGD